MRIINTEIIKDTVKNLCIDANYHLNGDILAALEGGLKKEKSPLGKTVLKRIIDNANMASHEKIAICQDTGMAVFFVDIGQDVHFTGQYITDAINEGVRRGYEEGYLRNSVVSDPLLRDNTNDNTPAVIHYDLIPGDRVRIVAVPKGFGSENMSRVGMLKPSDGEEGLKDFVLNTVEGASANACPPIIVGVGAGGTMEKAAILAKKALTLPLDYVNKEEHIRRIKGELLEKINMLGIGPAGYGGLVTALGVNILFSPTHIAGLPVAVNINCHVARHKEVVL